MSFSLSTFVFDVGSFILLFGEVYFTEIHDIKPDHKNGEIEALDLILCPAEPRGEKRRAESLSGEERR